MLNYALRVNLTIAIVEMVAPTPTATESIANGNSLILHNTTMATANTTVELFFIKIADLLLKYDKINF